MVGIRHPILQPLRFRLRADARQFRPDVTSDHHSGGVLHGVARCAEGLTVERGASRWICGRLRVSLHRLDGRIERRALREDECRDVARVGIAQVIVRHGCRAGVGLGIFDPGVDPLARGLVGNMLQRRRIIVRNDVCAIRLLDGVAVRAAVAGDELSPLVKERGSGLVFQMALAAAGFDVLCRQQRLFPLLGTAMRLLYGGRSTLSAMAGRAAELRQRVRNYRMLAKCYRADIRKARFFHPEMAGGATVGHLLLGYPYLLDPSLEVPFKGDGVGASADET